MRISISLKILLIIVLSLTLQGFLLFWLQSSSLEADALSTTEKDYRIRSIALQQTLTFLVQKEEFSQLQQTITALGSDTKINAAYLLNESNRVIASTQISNLKEEIFTLLDPIAIELLSQQMPLLRENLKISLWNSVDGKTLYAAAPIEFGLVSKESLRLKKVGILLLDIDLQWIKSSVNQNLLTQAPKILAILLGFILFLMMYFHFFISRRIDSIRHTTSGFLLGQPLVANILPGNDELSDLQNTFISIASQASKQHQALIENEQRLNKTQEIAKLGSWELDLTSNTLIWTDEVYRIFGLRPQEFPATYEAFLDVIHPDDRKFVDAAYLKSIEQGKDEYEIEHRIVRKATGNIRYVVEKCVHYRDASGKVIRSVGMVHDITESKLMEESEKQSQLLFKHVIDASPVPYALNDNSNNINYINPAFTDIFGYELSDIPTLLDWWPKAYPDAHYREEVSKTWENHLAYAIETQTPFKPIEIQVRCKDGTDRTVLASATLLTKNFHEQHLVILYDITERKKIEITLRSQQAEQQQILNAMVDAVITINSHGEILSFNSSAEKMYGFNQKEVVGNNIKILMPEKYAENHDQYLENYCNTSIAKIIGIGREVEGQRKNGEVFPMRLSVAELPNSQEGTRRFIGTCHDITQLKQQEELLRHSQKLEALGKLTGGIAHDFNNMLGVILGYSELLQYQLAENPQQKKYINEIYKAGERAKKLTSKLLSFSRKKPVHTENTDLNELLNNNRHMLEKTLTARINFKLDLASDLWLVRLDKASLEDCILNISINAMHAMPDGGTFTVASSNIGLSIADARPLDMSPGDYVLLTLTDSGMGMDPEIRQKIFDPFFTTKDEGTGLGLSQVYGFVKQSGGAINVYSEKNHGTQISIYFPRYADDTPENQDGHTEKMAHSNNEIILVVDDEPALIELAREILSSHGYRVFTAASGQDALGILTHEKIDVLLTDIIMPGMDGYQLSAEVQQRYPLVKIQLASGFSDERNSQLIHSDLYQKRLQKPFSSQDLLKSIRELLDTP